MALQKPQKQIRFILQNISRTTDSLFIKLTNKKGLCAWCTFDLIHKQFKKNTICDKNGTLEMLENYQFRF
jgi:hypothetical protein